MKTSEDYVSDLAVGYAERARNGQGQPYGSSWLIRIAEAFEAGYRREGPFPNATKFERPLQAAWYAGRDRQNLEAFGAGEMPLDPPEVSNG